MNNELTIGAKASLEPILARRTVSDERRKSLELAIAAGVDQETLDTLGDAARLSRSSTIVLPHHRYEHLSRGRGWARKGTGPNVEWGQRVGNGYRVGPGHWSVGSTDGFSRKGGVDWVVRHISVGPETWTIAD